MKEQVYILISHELDIGLGNKFLANIRSVNSIVHLVRCFSDINIIHVVTSELLNSHYRKM